jgi:hypothetical protein
MKLQLLVLGVILAVASYVTITTSLASSLQSSNDNNVNTEASLSNPSSQSSSRQLLSLRDTFLESSWVDSLSAGRSAMSFLHSLPRIDYKGASQPHEIPTIPRDGAGNKDYQTAIENYLGGVAGIMGFLIVACILSLMSCCCFCLFRCACNSCGGRQPKREEYYLRPDIICMRVTVCILVIFLAVACAFGWSGNVGVSTGIDQMVAGGDAVVDYSTEWANLMTTVSSSSRSRSRPQPILK